MAKMSEQEKRIHARNAIKGQAEPKINMLTYDQDILSYMNYHTTCSSDDERRRWVAFGMVAMDRRDDIQWLEDSTDFELSQIGPLMHARDRDMYLSNEHLSFIDKEVNRLVAKYKTKAEAPVEEVKSGPTADQKNEAMARHLYGEHIQGAVDEFWTTYKSDFNLKAWLLFNNVTPAVAELMAEKLATTVLELKTAVERTDDQINESYSNLTAKQIKILFEYTRDILQNLVNHAQVIKAMRKPRVSTKPKASPVAKLKYLESFMELNLRSVDPQVILGADEFYAYRTNRRFIYYKAKDGEKLSIAGQTILNYDEEKSGAKTIKKPEKFFMNLNTGKVALRTLFQNVESSRGNPPARITDDMILLKAFS
jgi:hypothetical protein